jgi:Fic family protein
MRPFFHCLLIKTDTKGVDHLRKVIKEKEKEKDNQHKNHESYDIHDIFCRSIPLSNIVSVTYKYSKSKNVPHLMESFLQYFNQNLNDIMEHKTHLAPIEFAADAQRRYVQIHPFHEGNGRISRYLQDMITLTFGLPFIPGGLLQNDVLTPQDEYREQTYHQVETILFLLEQCLHEYQEHKKTNGLSPISFSCRQHLRPSSL